MNASDLKLRPYQLACIYKIQSDIERGQNRIFINMPTGSGKLRTISGYFKMYLENSKKVLFLHSLNILVEQSKSFLSQSLSYEQYNVESIKNIQSLNINGYGYLVLELEDFRNKESLLEQIYQEFQGVIIGLYSMSTDTIFNFINKHGEVSYSLKISEELYEFLHTTNKIEDMNLVSQEDSFSTDSIDHALKYKPIKELVCSIICQKNSKSVDQQEIIIDLVSLLVGFIPLGPIVGFAFKYLYKKIVKYMSKKLKNKLNCSMCDQFS